AGRSEEVESSSSFNLQFLTQEEEIQVMSAVQRYHALHHLADELAREHKRSMSVGEWASAAGMDSNQLLNELSKGRRARSKLVKSHEVLVYSIAVKYRNSTKNMSLNDLIQEGSMGLCKAAEKYDPTRSTRFSTAARWWVRASILRAIDDKD
ncbi:unnamed protein product, partial [Heterosigma akashiwo]